MRVARWLAVAAIILALSSSCFAGFRLLFWRGTRGHMHDPRMRHPDQKLEVADLTGTLADQKCENWAWAADLESILKAQKVDLAQNFWVMKADGGEVCKDQIAAPEDLARLITGEYVLDDGRKVRLEASAVTGPPVSLDAMIEGPREGRPLIFIWKGHPYLYRGMTYDEMIAPNGQRDLEVHQIELLDPFESGDKQAVTFDRVKENPDDPNDIGGVIDVVATPIGSVDWLHPEEELDHPPEIYFPTK
jgi:hypothetical protein